MEERRETGVHLWQGQEEGAQLLSEYKSVERQSKASGEVLLRFSFIYLFIEASKRLEGKLSFTAVSSNRETEDKSKTPKQNVIK